MAALQWCAAAPVRCVSIMPASPLRLPSHLGRRRALSGEPVLCGRSSAVVCVSSNLPVRPTRISLLGIHEFVLCLCVSVSFASKITCAIFQIPRIATLYGACFSLLLYGSLHVCPQLRKWRCFLPWRGGVMFRCICAPHLCPSLCWWTFRLPPGPGCCERCCRGQWGACVFGNDGFLWVYAQEWGCRVLWWF